MTVRAILLALVVVVALARPAPANEPAAPTPSTAPPAPASPAIVLEAGKPVEIACETKAVVVAEGAPAATKGRLSLRLELRDTAPAPLDRWTIAEVEAAHTGSLATAQRTTCEAGCPMTLGPNGDIQLWAPAVKSLDALKEGETLLLAVVRADATLRASTFKGPQIEALEEGHCRRVGP